MLATPDTRHPVDFDSTGFVMTVVVVLLVVVLVDVLFVFVFEVEEPFVVDEVLSVEAVLVFVMHRRFTRRPVFGSKSSVQSVSWSCLMVAWFW
jgi:hypothetical protein